MWLFGRKKKAAKEAEAKRLEAERKAKEEAEAKKKAEEARKLEEAKKAEEKKQEEAKKAAAPAPKKAEAKEEKADSKKELKKVYHVVKRQKDNKWCVKIEGSTRAIKLFDNKVEALEYCEKLAANQNGTLKVHASKGKNKGRIQSN